MRFEFTILLLVVSTCFIALNVPYFATWCHRLKHQIHNMLNTGNPTRTEHLRGTLYITKTIFSLNYCINIFLYSLTGANFRRQLKTLFCRVASKENNTITSKTAYSQISASPGHSSIHNIHTQASNSPHPSLKWDCTSSV